MLKADKKGAENRPIKMREKIVKDGENLAKVCDFA